MTIHSCSGCLRVTSRPGRCVACDGGNRSTVGPRPGATAGTFSPVEMSDPRLEWVVTHTLYIDDHSGRMYRVLSATWRIENAGGTWQGSEHSVILADGSRTTA